MSLRIAVGMSCVGALLGCGSDGTTSTAGAAGAHAGSGSRAEGTRSSSGGTGAQSGTPASNTDLTGGTRDPGAGGASSTDTGGANDSGTGGGDGSDSFAQARQDCVDRINAFRATEGKAPYDRWVDAEACADEQAQRDGEANDAHGNFGMCDERAQNTCLWRRSLESIIQNCLQSMWDEGPGEDFNAHGHYLNMSSTQYTRVACGFYQGADGRIWASQNFR